MKNPCRILANPDRKNPDRIFLVVGKPRCDNAKVLRTFALLSSLAADENIYGRVGRAIPSFS